MAKKRKTKTITTKSSFGDETTVEVDETHDVVEETPTPTPTPTAETPKSKPKPPANSSSGMGFCGADDETDWR